MPRPMIPLQDEEGSLSIPDLDSQRRSKGELSNLDQTHFDLPVSDVLEKSDRSCFLVHLSKSKLPEW